MKPQAWRVAAGLLVAGLMLAPLPAGLDAPGWRAAGATVHAAVFAALAWFWLAPGSGISRAWRVWLWLAVLAAGMEWIQPRTGRTAEWADWFYGIAGAALVCVTRTRARLRVLTLAGLCAWPWCWEALMRQREILAFPVLADPTAVWARRGWNLNGVALREEDGYFRLDISRTAVPAAYPGGFRRPAKPDWQGLESLQFRLFWSENTPATWAFRVDDRPDNPPYADRFQREFSVAPGWNTVLISRAELGLTTGGRSLDLARIRTWGVFLVSDVSFDYVLIGPVHLAIQQEPP